MKDRNKINKCFYNDGQTTVCLLIGQDKETVLSRGIAICSRDDYYSPKDGRDMAYQRAREALGRKADCGEIKLDAVRSHPCDQITLSLARDRFGDYKGYYMPTPTDTEKMLIGFKYSKCTNTKLTANSRSRKQQAPHLVLVQV